MNQSKHLWLFGVLFLSAFLLYLSTLAPDLTWAHDSADSGDLITAAYTDGVAHPTGYPTYLLAAKIFQQIPFGNLAWRTNLMSSFFMAAASALLAYFTYAWMANSDLPSRIRTTICLVTGAAFAINPLVWGQAVVTEVHALHLFLIAVLFCTLLSKQSGKTILFGGILAGIAIGNHVTFSLIVPVWLFFATLGQGNFSFRKNDLALRRAVLGLAGLSIGLSIYLLIPIWASGDSPVIWGNPTNVEGFWWLISGKFYQSNLLSSEIGFAPGRFFQGLELLFTSLGVFTIPLLWFLLRNRDLNMKLLLPLWLCIVSILFYFLYQVNDSELYLLPGIMGISLFTAYGLQEIAKRALETNAIIRWGLLILLLGALGFQTVSNYPAADVSQDHEAVYLGKGVLRSAPLHGILIANNDQEALALWYYHFARGMRPDVAIVVDGLMQEIWYLDLLGKVYPSLNVPRGYSTNDWRKIFKQFNPENYVCTINEESEAELSCY